MGELIDKLLPPIREARRPIITGSLWILFVWMWIADDIPEFPDGAEDPWSDRLYEALGAIGPVGRIAVFTLMASLIGSLVGDALRAAWNFDRAAPATLKDRLEIARLARSDTARLSHSDRADNIAASASEVPHAIRLLGRLDTRSERLLAEAKADVDAAAGRLESQALLRYELSLPLLALATTPECPWLVRVSLVVVALLLASHGLIVHTSGLRHYEDYFIQNATEPPK